MNALIYYPLVSLALYATIMLSFLALHVFLPTITIFGFLFRLMAAYVSLVMCAAYGTTASLLLRPLGLHYKYAQWTTARSFKWVCRYTIGVQFDILGNGTEVLNRKRPYVIVCNHQTELDVLLLGWIWPKHCSVTAKKSLKRVPFLGWFMALSGSIFIDRVDRTQALKAFEGAARVMREKGQSVMIFPEGTRSYSKEPMLLPFKKGAFHMAVQGQVDILPVVAENYSRVLNVKDKRFEAGTIRVKVLEPISTKGLTAADVNRLTDDVRGKMLEALHEMAADQESRSLKAHAS